MAILHKNELSYNVYERKLRKNPSKNKWDPNPEYATFLKGEEWITNQEKLKFWDGSCMLTSDGKFNIDFFKTVKAVWVESTGTGRVCIYRFRGRPTMMIQEDLIKAAMEQKTADRGSSAYNHGLFHGEILQKYINDCNVKLVISNIDLCILLDYCEAESCFCDEDTNTWYFDSELSE